MPSILLILTDAQRQAILEPFFEMFGEDYFVMARVLVCLEKGILDTLGLTQDWASSLANKATTHFTRGLSDSWWSAEVDRIAGPLR